MAFLEVVSRSVASHDWTVRLISAGISAGAKCPIPSMMLKVRALSSEGRMTAVILTGLPIFAFTMLFLIRPDFYLDVAGDPAFLPGFASLLVLYAVGFYAIRRLVDLKV